jgi:hypothetical protein
MHRDAAGSGEAIFPTFFMAGFECSTECAPAVQRLWQMDVHGADPPKARLRSFARNA